MEFWNEINAYDRAQRDTEDELFFLDGPPNPSGDTHLGTVWNKILKDTIIRVGRMSEYAVVDRPGFDTQLFITEQRIASERGIESLAALSDFGVETFEQQCHQLESDFIETLKDDFQDCGIWMDWDNSYRTDSPAYADSAWWTFSRIADNGYLAKGDQVVNWCPECRAPRYKRSEVDTAELRYRDPPEQQQHTLFVAYPIVGKTAALVTRVSERWEVLANSFLAVEHNDEYVKLSFPDFSRPDLYVAADSYQTVVPETEGVEFEVVDRVSGSFFASHSYEHPLTENGGCDHGGQILTVDSLSERTGIRHGTPATSERDRRLATTHDLLVLEPIDEAGRIRNTGTPFDGDGLRTREEVRSIGDEIQQSLAEDGYVIRRGASHDRTDQCWLCGGEVLPRIDTAWYIKLDGLKDQIDRAIESTEWYPNTTEAEMKSPSSWHPDWSRDPRFVHEPAVNHDWLIEQESTWGLPMPIWAAETDPNDYIVIESRAELSRRADQEIEPDDLIPRKSVLDNITITEGGTTYQRVSGIFADRYSAGLAAVAVAGAPDDMTMFDQRFPADIIVEARDQPSIWFFMQLAIGVTGFDEMPFDRALMHGFLTDENGEKMSKSVGNIVTPGEVVDRYGADPVRLYLLKNTRWNRDIPVEWDEIETLTSLLADMIDAVDTALALVDSVPSVTGHDTALARAYTNALSAIERESDRITESLRSFDFAAAVDRLLPLIYSLTTRSYLPTVIQYGEDNEQLPTEVQTELEHILELLARLLAPYSPHIAERIYQSVCDGEKTVHELSFPFGHQPAAVWQE
ncbi:class I tRNA ligase family protein [Natrinema halophilum]|nr:class I tRNA ligase family protein [Natrinema halophilum]QLG49958.2 class I tRNA ligase family protein [Natrinema halophilum]